MAINKLDFIEISYSGKTKDDNVWFDTTDEAVAKAHNLFNPKLIYKPVIICVGKEQVIKGLDNFMIGKSIGKYTLDVKSEEAFGKKDAKLLKLIPIKFFQKEKIRPFPGLDVEVDGRVGLVKSVSGGRVIVDFNNPLSGKDVSYDVEIKRIVLDPTEKINSLLSMMKFPYKAASVADDVASISIEFDLPKEIVAALEKDIVETIGVKSLKIVQVESVKINKTTA